MNNFKETLDTAIKRCCGEKIKDEAYDLGFNTIYPFTTENINGYINNFDLNNKSLLTVGSSGDQVLNSILNGCKDVTVIDINSYTKFYYYLKCAGILNLDIEELLKYLIYNNFPKYYTNNTDVLNVEVYKKIKATLKKLDSESYVFWNTLFKKFNPLDIREHLFKNNENKKSVICECNKYLDKNNYELLRDNIKNIKPTFINGNLFNENFDRTFDNIWLSNVGTYLRLGELKRLVIKYSKLLNKDGNLLICYLHGTSGNHLKVKSSFMDIYNLDRTMYALREYDPHMVSFDGIDRLNFMQNEKDSILIYKKN